MNNPFTDLRAGDLLSASPTETEALASQFHSVAATAELGATALTKAYWEPNWIGSAAEAFKESVQTLPAELSNVAKSYNDVVMALRSYGKELDTLQGQFQTVRAEYEQAMATLKKAQEADEAAEKALSDAQANPYLPHPTQPPNPMFQPHAPWSSLTGPPAPGSGPGRYGTNGVWYPQPGPPRLSPDQVLTSAQTAAWKTRGALGSAQDEVDRLMTQGNNILEIFSTDREKAKSLVASAKGVAPKPPSVGWEQHVTNFTRGTLKGTWGLIKDVGKAAYHLPGAYVNLMEHPFDPDAWKTYGEDLGTVAGAVAVAAAIAAFPADAAGMEGLADALGGVAEGADTAGLVGTVDKTTGDVGSLIKGDGDWGDILGDAESLGFSGLTSRLGKEAEDGVKDAKTAKNAVDGGVDAATSKGIGGLTADERAGLEDALKDDRDGIEQYNLNKALGATPQQAYKDLSKAQQAQLEDAVKRLSNAQDVAGMKSGAEDAVKGAEKHAKHVDHAGTIAGWLHDQAKDQLTGGDKKGGG